MVQRNIENRLLVRLYGNEIRCLHRHCMLIDPEFEVLIRRRVDQSNTVLLPRDKCEFAKFSSSMELVLAIDETVVPGRWTIDTYLKPFSKCRRVVPILDHDRSQIYIPIRARGTVDDQWTNHSLRVLKREMTVIPGGPVTCGMKPVRKRMTRRNGTSRSDTNQKETHVA